MALPIISKEENQEATTSIAGSSLQSHLERAFCKDDCASTPSSSSSPFSTRPNASPGQHIFWTMLADANVAKMIVIVALNCLSGFLPIHCKHPSRYKPLKRTLNKSITTANYIKNRCGNNVKKYRRFLPVVEGYQMRKISEVENNHHFLTAVEGYRTGKSTKEQLYKEIFDTLTSMLTR